MEPLISLRSVQRTFGSGPVAVTVLRDISLDIDLGDCVAVMGPSGSGKSTLMNMMGLLDQPSTGSIFIEGDDVSLLSDEDKAKLRGRKIGFVFQSYNLLPRNTAIENVTLPLVYAGVRRSHRFDRAAQALELVGMARRANHFPAQLSGGEQQRVAIARALVSDPAIILADEPTGALDSRTGAEILSLLRSLNRSGQTVVMITHDAQIAAQCERIVRLQDGEIISDAKARSLVRVAGGRA
ncbi:MAG TPA: ABC transporter ATP-binding protein [Pseudolabrys sp.]|nr:ABC transporter ATP-binding protein [Pseudolabrys sp.]